MVNKVVVLGRRSEFEIVGDILRLGNNVNRNRIMYEANLSYYQLQKYLGFLIAHGFLEELPNGNLHPRYNPTPKGETLLENIDRVMDFLGRYE